MYLTYIHRKQIKMFVIVINVIKVFMTSKIINDECSLTTLELGLKDTRKWMEMLCKGLLYHCFVISPMFSNIFERVHMFLWTVYSKTTSRGKDMLPFWGDSLQSERLIQLPRCFVGIAGCWSHDGIHKLQQRFLNALPENCGLLSFTNVSGTLWHASIWDASKC